MLLAAAAAGFVLFVLAAIGVAAFPDLLASSWVAAGLLFLVVLAYQGVRLGRSTHLVDMVPAEDRAVYTAVSNTAVGVVILLAGAFGALSDVIGLGGLFSVFALACGLAWWVTRGLDEVQGLTH